MDWNTALPAAFPGAREQRVVVLELHGPFVAHPGAAPPGEDAYSLFYDRSTAMGWLTDAMGGPTSLWAMHEGEAEPNRCWFQVDVTSDSSLLPLMPLFACAGDVVHRLGTFTLEAVELQLPPPAAPPSRQIAMELITANGWFGNCAPSHRRAIEVAIGGVDVSVVAEWMRPWVQSVFVCDSAAATLRGTVVEWSLDALGWTAAFVAQACHAVGVDIPLSMRLTPTT
ncbi:MAG TPA: hypothetical protein VH914_09340 [Acidimicrobiia bacterium]|nr:hypothetical protein [Acidimicrobiia bacterium]